MKQDGGGLLRKGFQAGLELVVLLLQPPKCSDYRCKQLWPAWRPCLIERPVSVEETAFKEVRVNLDVVGQMKMNKEKVRCMLGGRNVL